MAPGPSAPAGGGGARWPGPGPRRRCSCETPGYALVCALVSAGLGVAVVPEMVARDRGDAGGRRGCWSRRRCAVRSRSSTGPTRRHPRPTRSGPCCAARSAADARPGRGTGADSADGSWLAGPPLRRPAGLGPRPAGPGPSTGVRSRPSCRPPGWAGRCSLPPHSAVSQRMITMPRPLSCWTAAGSRLGKRGWLSVTPMRRCSSRSRRDVHREGGRLPEGVLYGVGGEFGDDQPDGVGGFGVARQAPFGQHARRRMCGPRRPRRDRSAE